MAQPNQKKHISLENEVMRHEDNLKFLNSQANRIDEHVLDLQVSLGRYHSANVTRTENGNGTFHTEEETVQQILQKENSAAAIFCWLKANTSTLSSTLSFTKDVVGIVATLARADNDELSRNFSEFLGLETMLAIVCKTKEGVKALESYDAEGAIKGNDGLHALGSSFGKGIKGRFTIICLEELRPFIGGFVADDPQKKLAIQKPKLPNGEFPHGFIDYAVNMIHLDSKYLSCFTPSGYGLRETLFYSLFSRLQIYRTRKDMLNALPCINAGALSLDGGMIKESGVFVLGSRKAVDVRFPIISGESDLPENYIEAEEVIRRMKWERSKLAVDVQREQQLLDCAKANFTNRV
ncbi:hypothetical protein L6164_004039 [Bauhinia variegata]|uniref:Uncharacterized protein n=2 Tax=Bauhinia variegata TaxID=167791 RepID=A0ACB9Q5E3_BAUVA|nr:hypothetical protein L6164_004039 [Bauhinia variegata]KAI4355247.1 hypothetical protein L6164_004039 [Bauhinia variegata]